MYTIWKYPLQHTDEQQLQIASGDILGIHKQGDDAVLYVKKEVDNIEQTTISVIQAGTGHKRDIPAGYEYNNTLSFMNDKLMFHYFIRKW